ncbi:MAG: TspO/MBR family protein [bacterium]
MGNKNPLKHIYRVRILFTWIFISYLALIPSLFVSIPRGWYDALLKPPGVPPGWVISVVWVTLYTLLGIAAYRVWTRGLISGFRKEAIGLFLSQLIINAAFNPVFFGFQSLTGGLVILFLLIVLVSITALYFFVVHRPAGLIIFIYLLWLFYAFYLNLFMWLMNVVAI